MLIHTALWRTTETTTEETEMKLYEAVAGPDTLHTGRFAVQYATAEHAVTVRNLNKFTAEELAKLLNASTDIQISGVFN